MPERRARDGVEAKTLARNRVQDLMAARETLYFLRQWPVVRKEWLAAIEGGRPVHTMHPDDARKRLEARDRLYARALATVEEFTEHANAAGHGSTNGRSLIRGR